MLYIKTLDQGRNLLKALGSDIRIDIIKCLLKNKAMNMNELAIKLNITNWALTSHIKKLEKCGIIHISNGSEGHGNQKICSVHLDKILINLELEKEPQNTYVTEIKIGHYTNYKVYPTCGLASSSKIIGEVDDSRYFAHPDRYDADIL